MEKKNILDTLIWFKQTHIDTPFVDETIEKIKTEYDSQIPRDPHILFAIKLQLLHKGIEHLPIYLLDTTNTSMDERNCLTYIKLSLNEKQANNFINYIHSLNENTLKMCNELSTDVRDFYLIVSPTDTANMTKISRDLYYDYVNIFCSLHLPTPISNR
jgi:hypothetical protein